MLGLPAERVTVAPPGVEPRFSPGGDAARRCPWWWRSAAWCR